jgi:2-iminobutanoate/2-iminopropanoate deaminase
MQQMKLKTVVAVSLLAFVAAAFLAATRNTWAGSVQLSKGTVLPRSLPLSETARTGGFLYLSGMLGVLPGTSQLVAGGIGEEARQTMQNIRAVLAAQGHQLDDLVKCTVMLADMADWGTFNVIYESFFDGRYPVRSAFGTTGLALGARVEVECIASVSE